MLARALPPQLLPQLLPPLLLLLLLLLLPLTRRRRRGVSGAPVLSTACLFGVLLASLESLRVRRACAPCMQAARMLRSHPQRVQWSQNDTAWLSARIARGAVSAR